MTTRYVDWCSVEKLKCAFQKDAAVILCLDPAITIAPTDCPSPSEDNYTFTYITAGICPGSVYTLSDSACNQRWHYTFSYESEDLLQPDRLMPQDLLGVVCLDCLTTWASENIGNEVQIRDDEGGGQTLITQHGCEYPINTGQEVCVTDTVTLDLTLDPDTGCISGDVQVSADADNALSIHSDGLYATGGGGNAAWELLGNAGTVAGTNFIGTTDNISHDVRVNNVQARRTIPDAACPNIFDGQYDNLTPDTPDSLTGCTISGGGGDTSVFLDKHEILDGYFTTIGGGCNNLFIPDAVLTTFDGFDWYGGFSTISGGFDNLIEMDKVPWSDLSPFQGYGTIGGGFDNLIICSDYCTIGGGSVNNIDYYANGVGNYAAQQPIFGNTIAGGVSNEHKQRGPSLPAGSPSLPINLGLNTTAGGSNNGQYGTVLSTIGGGGNNFIQTNASSQQGPVSFSTICGGLANIIQGGTREIIGGGFYNIVQNCDSSGIFSGYANLVYDGGTSLYVQFPDNGTVARPNNTNNIGSAILGGLVNWIVSGKCSSILGGAFLQLGNFSCGFQSASTRSFAAINGASIQTINAVLPTPQVDLTAFSNISYWGDVDIWIGNTNNSARKLLFFEPNSDTDYSSANYSSFKAQAQSANIDYIWPASAGTAGQVLTIDTVVGTVVTLKWA